MIKIRKYLLDHGIRPSAQRIAVMKYLMDNRTHPTVDQIYSALYPEMPTLSKTTVYNTLKVLEGQGAIISIDIDRACERFDADVSNHGHALCLHCGMISDIELGDEHFIMANAPQGMDVFNVQLLYKGVCSDCSKKADKEIAN